MSEETKIVKENWARKISMTAYRTGLALLVLAAVLVGPSAEARVKSNTQVRLPHDLYLGDVDGDGSADFLQVAGNRLFVFRTNYEATGILHHYFPTNISRLIIGDFVNRGRDQVCAILTDGSFQCYAISDDLQSLWWGLTQPNFIADDEHGIVGDFDGDGADDILVYKPSTGTLRMYTQMVTGYFTPMPNFSLGDLAGVNLANKLILAGEFGQAAGRDDLLVLDATNGQVTRLDSVTDGSGYKTFWWAFTTNPGAFSTDEQVSVANVDGSALDSIVLRSTSTGNYRMFRAAYSGGYLAPVTNVTTGQLPVTTDRGQGFFARLKYLRSELGGTVRDDMLFFNYRTRRVIKTDARYDGSRYTYWWAYTKGTPTYNVGWPAMQEDKWVMLLCKYSDQLGEPATMDFFEQFFTGAGVGAGGMVDYFREISYGRVDLSSSEVKGWYTIPLTFNDARNNISRDWAGGASAACKNASGIDVRNYRGVVVLMNTPFNLNSAASGNEVYLDDLNLSTLAQEMLHVYGLWDHSWDDQGVEYGDRWDVMSAGNVPQFTGPRIAGSNGVQSGPELNAPYKLRIGYLPSTRVLTLNPDGRSTSTVSLAALNRPEANGALVVKIPVLGDPDPNHYYAIEFRQRWGWDAGIPQDTVLIHEVRNGISYLQTIQGGPQFLQNSVYRGPNFIITVNEVNAAEGTATVTVTY